MLERQKKILYQKDETGVKYKSPFKPIDYEVCFIPYYSQSKDSVLDNEMTMLSAQLNQQGKKKRIKSKNSLDTYLNDKLDLFF